MLPYEISFGLYRGDDILLGNKVTIRVNDIATAAEMLTIFNKFDFLNNYMQE